MKKIIFALTAIATIASCSKESVETPDIWSGELRITSGITTRASGTTWEKDDAIGVFMSEAGTVSAIGKHNTKYTTSSTEGTATFTVDSESTDLYYPQSSEVDIVAHYPYNDAATVDSYPVDVSNQTDIDGQTDLTAIDFMSAKMTNVEKSKDALQLEFYHLLSQLKITLAPTSGGGLTTSQLATATVKVSGTQVVATATVDYDTVEKAPTASYTLSGDKEELSAKASSSVATFIVVPQKTDVTFTITVASVGEFYVTVKDMELTSGDEHNYTISVSRTAATISGATISGWGDGAEADDTLDASDYVEPATVVIAASFNNDSTTPLITVTIDNSGVENIQYQRINYSYDTMSGGSAPVYDTTYTIEVYSLDKEYEIYIYTEFTDGTSSNSNVVTVSTSIVN